MQSMKSLTWTTVPTHDSAAQLQFLVTPHYLKEVREVREVREVTPFQCADTTVNIKMLTRLLTAIASKSFPCLAVVSWGWATSKKFTPLRMGDTADTVWATPQGSP